MQEHAWLRLQPLWYGIFYVMLVFTMVLVLTDMVRSAGSSVAILGLSVLLGLWYGCCISAFSRHLQRSPLILLAYLALGWGLWFWLTLLDSSYMLLLFGLYPQALCFGSTSWKIFHIVFLTLLSLWRQVLFLRGFGGSLLVTIAATICGILMTFFIEAIIRQSRERHRLLRELEETRHELAVAERRAGVTEERQRLAHEIHDTLVQGFTSIVMHLEAAEGVMVSDKETGQRHLEQARHTARENLIEARRLMWALQPKAFDHARLPEALTHLTNSWSEENKVAASVTITSSACSLRPEIEVTLLRAAQEALVNAARHAHAEMVTITLSYMKDEVALDVQDDGCGFDMQQLPALPDGHTASGFGLKALRERVAQLNGRLSIESVPGEGTTIAVALPVVSNESFLCADVAFEKERKL
jgi:signal transduction histidine kinase